MKYLLIICFICVQSMQAQIGATSEKKIQGEISHSYNTYLSLSMSITYKSHPFVGQGPYTYRWRVEGSKFGASSSSNTYQLAYNCNDHEKPISVVFCEITETSTGKKFVIKKKHVVEACTNR